MEGELCEVCWRGNKILQNGMLVCDVCGTVDQGFAQEEAEQDFENSRRRRLGGTHVATGRPAPLRERRVLDVAEAVEAYVRELQRLLRRQADDLVDACGIDRAVRQALRALWIARIARSGVLSPAWMVSVQREVRSSQMSDCGPSGSAGEVSRPHVILADRLERTLPPSTTLELVLAACWTVRAPVDAADVVRWALCGRLTYLAFWELANESLRPLSAVLHPRLAHPGGAPSPHRLHVLAAEAAASTGTPVPSANPASWLDRWTRTLGLGEGVRDVALALLRAFCGDRERELDDPRGTPAEAASLDRQAAALLVALRMTYGLDRGLADDAPQGLASHAGGTTPLGLPSPPESWPSWALRALHVSGAEGLPGTPSPDDACRMGSRELTRYLARLRATYFASNQADPRLGPHAEILVRAAEENSGDSGDWLLPEHVGMAPRAPAEVDETGNGQEALRLTHLSSSRGAAELPRDYAAALAVVSAIVWTDPLELHSFVVQLEQAIVSAEVSLAYEIEGGLGGQFGRVIGLQAHHWDGAQAFARELRLLAAVRQRDATRGLRAA